LSNDLNEGGTSKGNIIEETCVVSSPECESKTLLPQNPTS